ncbi:MAG: twin-arginine translocase subunit TatC [Fuerstiella sp.]|nr:twin-arginine translocase subunit TatC [Fuerstiella sp.]
MSRNRDLFDDTTMTFGEHLEVLRVHVWKSLIGIVIGVIVSMFIGDKIIGFLKAPIDRALRDANAAPVEDDLGDRSLFDFVKSWWTDDETETTGSESVKPQVDRDTIVVDVQIQDLTKILQTVAPELLVSVEDPAAVLQSDDAQANESQRGKTAQSVSLPISSPLFNSFRKAADRGNTPTTFRVEEAFMTFLKVTLVAGLMLASPWVFYQVWEFVAAGLYPHERKYVHRYLPMSIGLFGAGAMFCFYFVFPLVLKFLIAFTLWMGIELIPRLSEYITLVLMLPMMFGISFQLPLVMLFLERIGIVTVQTYTENWRMAVLVMSVVSMLLTPADPGSMLLMLAPLVVLYFGGIQLCRMKPPAAEDPLA